MNKKFWQKSNLDELQEQKLLHIEKNGFWLLYLLLLAEILVKLLVFGSPKAVCGEMICFLAACVYVVAACIRNGIWDRHLKADFRTNLLVSVTASVVVMCINGVFAWKLYQAEGRWLLMALFAGISGAVTFAVCFAALNLLSGIYKKRLEKLEESEEENDD